MEEIKSEETVLTLKSLEKQVRQKMAILDTKINKLERKIDTIIKSLRSK